MPRWRSADAHCPALFGTPYSALITCAGDNHMADELVFYTNPPNHAVASPAGCLRKSVSPTKPKCSIMASTMKGSAYLGINPMGKVPALRHGDAVSSQRLPAICAYLADAFPQDETCTAAGRPPARAELPLDVLRRRPGRGGKTSNKALNFVVPPGRERMIGYGTYEQTLNALERCGVEGKIPAWRQFQRRGCLCRISDRFRPDVWNHGETPCL